MSRLMKKVRRIGYELSKTPLRAPLVWVRHRGIRQSDVFLASYPRSGNTWLRFLLAEILTENKVDFDNINRFIPELGLHRSAATLLPRDGSLIKTHEPHRAEYKRAVYLVRDIRDVALSNYARGRELGVLEGTSFDDFLPSFLDGSASRVGSWMSHVRSWRESLLAESSDLLLVKYEELRRDPEMNLMNLLSFLGVPADRSKVQKAVQNNSLARMRQKEDRSRALPLSSNENGRFVRSGAITGWKQRLTQHQIQLIEIGAGAELSSLGYPIGLEQLKPCGTS